MRILTFALVALLCGAVFADDINCNALTTSDTCNAEASTCVFQATGTKCSTKCSALLTANDCNAQPDNCAYSQAECVAKDTDCASVTGDLATTCTAFGNKTCQYTAPQDTCTVTDATTKSCSDQTTYPTCDATNCTFTATTPSCQPNNNYAGCASFANCNPTYCTSAAPTCESVSTCAGDETACSGLPGCTWNATACVSACALNAASDACTDTDVNNCTFNAGTCTFNTDAAKGVCNPIGNDKDCVANTACQSESVGTCAVNTNICTPGANCNETLCTAGTIAATCANTVCASTDPKNCDTGCAATTAGCAAKDATICVDSKTTQSTCETNTTYCSFITIGTCSAKSAGESSGIYLAFTVLSMIISLLI